MPRVTTALQGDPVQLPDGLIRASDLLHEAAVILGAHLGKCDGRSCIPQKLAEAACMAEEARDTIQWAYNMDKSDRERAARQTQSS